MAAQKNHHQAADECLMLRYKNSLLERILLEKGKDEPSTNKPRLPDINPGIDVQAELQQRAEHSHLPTSNPTTAVPQASPVHSAIMNRYSQTRRSNSGHAPRVHANQPLAPAATAQSQSPRLQPTPPSQNLSPTAMAKTPVGLVQGGKSSPGSELQAQRHQQPRLKPRPQHAQSMANLMPQPVGSGSHTSPAEMKSGGGSSGSGSSYYQSPFHNHIQQLGKLAPIPPFLLI